MILNTDKRVFLCVRRDSFWIFFFQAFIYLTLIFYMRIYKKEYISRFSAPDNMLLIPVTSITHRPHTSDAGPGRAARGRRTLSPLRSSPAACLSLSCLTWRCFFLLLLTRFPKRLRGVRIAPQAQCPPLSWEVRGRVPSGKAPWLSPAGCLRAAALCRQ